MGQTSEQSPSYARSILGTCCIPWTAEFQLDELLFRRSVRHAIQHGTRHLYVFGTAGEGHAVSETQFRQITRAFVEEMRSSGGAEPMVGLISLSMAQVIERIEWALTVGVREFQLSLPSWGTCTESETFTFFERVCTRFPQCSFLHYNVRRSGRLLGAAEYGRLSAAFDNLVAVKLAGASGEDALAVQNAAPRLRLFLTEMAFADGCALGVDAGFLISFASLNWRLARRYFDAVVAGDQARVAATRQEHQAIITLLREAVGTAVHMDGAFDLMFVKRYLPEFPLRLLPPYAGVSEAGFTQFIDSIRRQYPEWLDPQVDVLVEGRQPASRPSRG